MKTSLLVLLAFVAFQQDQQHALVWRLTYEGLSDQFEYVKHYKIGGKEYSNEGNTYQYACVLSKNTDYQFVLAQNRETTTQKVKVRLLDVKSNPVFSYEGTDTLIQVFNIQIAHTGIYYLSFEWESAPFYGVIAQGYCRIYLKPEHKYSVILGYYDAKEYIIRGAAFIGETDRNGQLTLRYEINENDPESPFESWEGTFNTINKPYWQIKQELEDRFKKIKPNLDVEELTLKELKD